MADTSTLSLVKLATMLRAGLGHQLGQEARLLRAEASQKVSVLTAVGAWAIAGVIVGAFSFGAILTTGVLFLISLGFAPAVATLFVAVILACGAAACLITARILLRDWTVVPTRTLAAVRADIDAIEKAVANVSS